MCVAKRRRAEPAARAQLVEELEATLRENEALHAQLVAQAREDGVLDERQRMAREIHDTLAQGLTGIITQLEAAEQARRPDDWRRHVDAAPRARAREPDRGAPLGAGDAPGAAGGRAAARGAGERGAALVASCTACRADVTTTGEPRALRPGGRGGAAAGRAGGARERRQARRRRAASG